MADMHVTSQQGHNRWQVIMHFAVPDAVNAVGVNYRTALANSGKQSEGSRLPAGDGLNGTISTAEAAQIAAGEVVEHRSSINVDGNGDTMPSRVALLQGFYATEKTRVLDGLQEQLKFFGHNQAS